MDAILTIDRNKLNREAAELEAKLRMVRQLLAAVDEYYGSAIPAIPADEASDRPRRRIGIINPLTDLIREYGKRQGGTFRSDDMKSALSTVEPERLMYALSTMIEREEVETLTAPVGRRAGEYRLKGDE